jgi:hypothetical protein
MIAPDQRSAPRPEPPLREPGFQPLAPAGVGRQRPPLGRQHEFRQQQVARAQVRGETAGEAEAHQARGAFGDQTRRLDPRPLRAAAAADDAQVEPAQAAGFGA